jgi:hypothetical protein
VLFLCRYLLFISRSTIGPVVVALVVRLPPLRTV